jgi:hypothetical protein
VCSDWLSGAQDTSWRSGGGNRSISVVNVVDICSVRDGRDVGDVANVGDVDDAQVIGTVVIPREERFSRPEREPGHEINAY